MDSDGEDTPPLLQAAYAGDIYALRRAIADGADLNVEVTRLTPLEATINFMGGHGMRVGRTREFAMLLRAGAIIPRSMDLPPYLDAVAKAGGYERYERVHRSRLAAIFIPKFPRVPAEIIPTIVAFWADCGGH